MKCTCGFANEPWAEAELTIQAPLSETAEEELFESLSGIRGVRGVRITAEEGKVLVSYDATFISIDRLRAVTEGAGFPVMTAAPIDPPGNP